MSQLNENWAFSVPALPALLCASSPLCQRAVTRRNTVHHIQTPQKPCIWFCMCTVTGFSGKYSDEHLMNVTLNYFIASFMYNIVLQYDIWSSFMAKQQQKNNYEIKSWYYDKVLTQSYEIKSHNYQKKSKLWHWNYEKLLSQLWQNNIFWINIESLSIAIYCHNFNFWIFNYLNLLSHNFYLICHD